MVPVARFGVTLANTLPRLQRVLIALPLPRSTARAVDGGDAALVVAGSNQRRRMTKAISIAGLEHSRSRLDGIDEGRCGRGLAAVVGHDQHLAAQGLRLGCYWPGLPFA